MSLKVVAFDLFGTVFDATSADEQDRARYGECLRTWRDERRYIPVTAVESFYRLKPFLDSTDGLHSLQATGLKIVAASNIPVHYIKSMSHAAGITWDGILNLSSLEIYKPDLAAYAAICDLMRCEPKEVLMVTGNHGKAGIGDDIEPLKIGMQTAKIRRDSEIKTIVDLANQFKTVSPTA